MVNEDFSLTAKIKLDLSNLKKQIRGIPSQIQDGLKVNLQGTAGGGGKVDKFLSGIFKTNNKSLLFLGKIGIALGAVAVGIGVLSKASPKLQAAIDRLIKTLLLFLKPVGDLLAGFLNPIARFLREQQRRRARGEGPDEEGVPEDLLEQVQDQIEENLDAGITGLLDKKLPLPGFEPGGLKLPDFEIPEVPDLPILFEDPLGAVITLFDTLFFKPIKESFKLLGETIEKVFSKVLTFIEDNFLDPLGIDFEEMKKGLKILWTSIKDTAILVWDTLKTHILGVITAIKNAAIGIGGGIGGVIQSVGSFFAGGNGSQGGAVNQVNVNPAITITAGVSGTAGDSDIRDFARKVADEVDSQLTDKLRRLT